MKQTFRNLLTIFVASLCLFGQMHAQSKNEINWVGIEEAQSLMKDAPKPIFIDFTAKWCGWCKKMDKTTFADTKVANRLNEGFYSVKLDFDSKVVFAYKGDEYTAKQLAKEFGVTGLPTMIVISDNLTTVNTVVGYKTSKQFLKAIEIF